MSNLLRVELFKVIRGKVFWILLGIITIISFAVVFLFFLNEKGILEKIDGMDISVEVHPEATEFAPASGIHFLIEQIHAPDLFLTIIIISVLGSFLIATENSTGVVKNIVSIGYRRIEIYLAKNIVYSLSAIGFMLFFASILGVFGSIFFGFGDWPAPEMLAQTGKMIALTCLYAIAFSSIVMLFSMMSNGSGFAFLVSLGFYLIFGPVLNLLSYQYVIFEKLNHYSIYNRFTLLSHSDLAAKNLLELGILPFVTAMIFMVIGIVIFKKKDIQ